MYFITNRLPRQKEQSTSTTNRNWNFGKNSTGSVRSVYFCKREYVGKYREIGSKKLLKELAKDKNCKEIVLFVHGFNVLPEGNKDDGSDGAFRTAQDLQDLLDQQKPRHYLVLPLIWPTDDDFGIVKDYYDDRHTAMACGAPFARVLAKFLLWRANDGPQHGCFKRINLIAHSMGALVAYSTLTEWASVHGTPPQVFRNLFLFAPDLRNEVLHLNESGRALSDSAGIVSVYYARDDLAMSAGKVANLDRVVSRRLGHTGPEDMDQVASNVFAIDCSDFNTDYDSPTGHGYFLFSEKSKPGAGFKHMYATLAHKRPDTSDPVEVAMESSRSLYLPRDY